MREKIMNITTDALLTVFYYIMVWTVCMIVVAKYLIF